MTVWDPNFDQDNFGTCLFSIEQIIYLKEIMLVISWHIFKDDNLSEGENFSKDDDFSEDENFSEAKLVHPSSFQ